jgi:hypothetical protein
MTGGEGDQHFVFHSVATTTTKSVSTLQADIARVLDRIGIKHRMSKAGFECVHVPSIDVTSVLSPEALAANNATQRKAAASLVQNGLNDSVSSGGHGIPSVPSNGMFRKAAYP